MKEAILLAAYGAGGSRGAQTLSLFERQVRQHFPEACIRWAFTSALSRNRLSAARKKTDSVKKALCRLAFEKYPRVTVQSLHLTYGEEYRDLLAEIEKARRSCGAMDIRVGLPLLHDAEDFSLAAQALVRHLPAERRPDEAAVWVGHGTRHQDASPYARLNEAVARLGQGIFIGALDGSPGIQEIIPRLKEGHFTTVWLLPLLSVVGKHAAEDIGGENPSSWNVLLARIGLNCRTVLRGTIEYEGFSSIWLKHLQNAAP